MIARLRGSFWVRALVTAAVLAVLLWSVDAGEMLRAIGRLKPTAAAAVIVLLALDRLMMALRWVILLRATNQRVSAKSALWIFLVSSYVGGLVPALGADAARAYSLSLRTSRAEAAVASVAVDRVLGLLSILLLGIASAALWSASGNRGIVVVTGLLLAVSCTAVLWADTLIRASLPARWQQATIGRRLLKFADGFAEYRGHRSALAAVFLLSVFVQLLRISQAYLLGRGIGLGVPFAYYLVFMPVGLIALMLPISIAGFGAPQGLFIWLLRPQGVADADALALSTLINLSAIVANLPGAWLYLRATRSAPDAP